MEAALLHFIIGRRAGVAGPLKSPIERLEREVRERGCACAFSSLSEVRSPQSTVRRARAEHRFDSTPNIH